MDVDMGGWLGFSSPGFVPSMPIPAAFWFDGSTELYGDLITSDTPDLIFDPPGSGDEAATDIATLRELAVLLAEDLLILTEDLELITPEELEALGAEGGTDSEE